MVSVERQIIGPPSLPPQKNNLQPTFKDEAVHLVDHSILKKPSSTPQSPPLVEHSNNLLLHLDNQAKPVLPNSGSVFKKITEAFPFRKKDTNPNEKPKKRSGRGKSLKECNSCGEPHKRRYSCKELSQNKLSIARRPRRIKVIGSFLERQRRLFSRMRQKEPQTNPISGNNKRAA